MPRFLIWSYSYRTTSSHHPGQRLALNLRASRGSRKVMLNKPYTLYKCCKPSMSSRQRVIVKATQREDRLTHVLRTGMKVSATPKCTPKVAKFVGLLRKGMGSDEELAKLFKELVDEECNTGQPFWYIDVESGVLKLVNESPKEYPLLSVAWEEWENRKRDLLSVDDL